MAAPTKPPTLARFSSAAVGVAVSRSGVLNTVANVKATVLPAASAVPADNRPTPTEVRVAPGAGAGGTAAADGGAVVDADGADGADDGVDGGAVVDDNNKAASSTGDDMGGV